MTRRQLCSVQLCDVTCGGGRGVWTLLEGKDYVTELLGMSALLPGLGESWRNSSRHYEEQGSLQAWG